MNNGNIVRISEAASLALHAMTFLAAQEPDHAVSTRDIADVLHVSDNHLSKVAQRLAKSGLVVSRRGPGGGVLLAKPAADITLLDIYQAIEGEFKSAGCLLTTRVCDPGNCIFGDLLHSVNTQVRERLETTRLDSLAHVFGSPEQIAG